MNWDIVLSIIAGLATAIPLVIKLVQYVEKAVREKQAIKSRYCSLKWYFSMMRNCMDQAVS